MLYRVEVIQTNLFYIEAESPDEAKLIATENRVWDENQTGRDCFSVHFNIEESTDSWPTQEV